MLRHMQILQRLVLCSFALVGLAASAVGQNGGISPNQAQAPLKLKSPTDWQVFQRGPNGKADIPLVLDDESKGAKIVGARLWKHGNLGSESIEYIDGKLTGVPTGGPYTINLNAQDGRGLEIHNIFVGDLWVLAGQSNMEGVANMIDVTPPDPRVALLGMDGKWTQATEPLHWLVDSPDPVHSGDPKTRAARSEQQHKTRIKGAGLGLPFATTMVQATNVPVGLVACAHGGTSMEQWNPAKKDQGGKSLYGSMLRQIKLAGGKVKGVLWYQGESDAMGHGQPWKVYPKVFRDFIAAVRGDLGQPDLPFYLVQIGRFVSRTNSEGWNAVQEAERLIPEHVSNTAVVSAIDLELDDPIHVGTQGHKRLGRRLAQIALRELFGQIGASTPTFDKVMATQGALVVKFKGVNMNPSSGNEFGLRPERHIAGFSIRDADGAIIPSIFEAKVGPARDTVVLKLAGRPPKGSFLWYGHGINPDCNLTDEMDMAVPVFGPIALDDLIESMPAPVARRATARGASTATATATATATLTTAAATATATTNAPPVLALVITGDSVHDWKKTSELLKEILSEGGKVKVDVTATPSKDLTDENLAKYDVLILNYKDTPKGAPETHWTEANKRAFLKAIRDGKGLVVFHHASSAFIKPNWDEFEKAVAGGWRAQGFHGPRHVFSVKKTDVKHPISEGLPAGFEHAIDELYQNSMITPGSVVLATAFSDPSKPRGTGKDEPVVWVNSFGRGRVYENTLGHDAEAMGDKNYQEWLKRGVMWAAGRLD